MIAKITGRFKEPSPEKAFRESKLSLLRETDLFRHLTPSDMDEIERVTTMTTCRRGRAFYAAGQTGEVLFVLKRGRVQLYRLAEDGRKLVTGIVRAGSVFGEMPIVSQRMHDNYAEALEDCTLCVMSRADIEHLLLTKAQLALNVISILSERLLDVERRLEMQAYGTVRERLAALLLKLAGESDEVQGASHQQLGEIIGASRETVTRVLGGLRSEGLIDLSRSRVALLHRGGLMAIGSETGGKAQVLETVR